MHYYQKHIGDYIKDTAHLTMIEDGAYMRLLDLYYESDGNIPRETEAVCRKLRARTEEEIKAVETVLNEFFTYTKRDGWKQKRCDEEIAAYHEKAQRARENGKLGGRPSKTDPDNSGNPEGTKKKANQEPSTINQEPIEPPENKFSDDDLVTAKWMFQKIQSLAPKTKEPNFDKWADVIRLMRQRDNRTHHEICSIFEWANGDDFWQGNILSPTKLREHFDRLEIQAKKKAKRTKPTNDTEWMQLAKEVGAPRSATYNQIWAMANGG